MDLSLFLADTSKNRVLASKIPQVCKNEPCILGIDEAGRGPVLGPMVYGCSFYPKSFEKEFSQMKFADSKTLTEAQREELFEMLNNEENGQNIGWRIEILSPNFLSNSMLAMSKYNLNEISHDAAARLVREVVKQGAKITEVYVDTVGPADKYQAKLSAQFPDIKFTVCPKADSKYPSVSAASICAKVGRDRALKEWKFVEKFDQEMVAAKFTADKFGCGYPSDPKTKTFLKDVFDPVFGFPQLIRFSWSTAEKIVEKDGVNVDWLVTLLFPPLLFFFVIVDVFCTPGEMIYFKVEQNQRSQ